MLHVAVVQVSPLVRVRGVARGAQAAGHTGGRFPHNWQEKGLVAG